LHFPTNFPKNAEILNSVIVVVVVVENRHGNVHQRLPSPKSIDVSLGARLFSFLPPLAWRQARLLLVLINASESLLRASKETSRPFLKTGDERGQDDGGGKKDKKLKYIYIYKYIKTWSGRWGRQKKIKKIIYTYI
jgi:hypothetical protein